MPYKIEYLEQEGALITTYQGSLTDSDVINSGLEKTKLIDKLKSCRYSLTDLSAVNDFNLTATGIQKNVEITIKLSKEVKGVLIVFVLPTEVEFGMGRMWQAYAENNNLQSHIFRFRDEANKFIKNQLD